MTDHSQTGSPAQASSRLQEYLPYIIVALFVALAMFIRPELWIETLFAALFSVVALHVKSRNKAAEYTPPPSRSVAERGAAVEYRQNYAQTINALQFPVYLLDEKGAVRFFNDRARSAFGETAVGDRISRRFRSPDFRARIDEVLKSRQPINFSYNEPVPDDRWYNVEFSRLPTSEKWARDWQDLYLLAFHDQTEMRRIDQMRSDFIANASHELRTPLASLLGYIETIRGPAKNDLAAQERFTGTMLEQAERMSRLVNDLLSLSRIEMKAHVRPDGVADLREVLEKVVSALQTLAEQADLKIRLEMDEDLKIIGNQDELIQVFENLIENACKYGDEGGEVIVRAKRTSQGNAEKALVSVRDFGPGIPIEHQHRITERFYRIDVARSREKQGTGLGLAIVKHILNRHGTRLNLKSEPGDGAEFSVLFDLPQDG